jgi:hypothetical protein
MPRRKRVCWKAKKEMIGHLENDMKKMGVRGSTKIAREKRCMEIDHAGGQGPQCIIEPVEKREVTDET